MPVQKYKLHSNEGDGPRPCAFFASGKGCRNGDNCQFSHEKAAPKSLNYASLAMTKSPVDTSPEEKSVVSSESGGELDNPFDLDTPHAADADESGKKRKNRRAADSDPFPKKKEEVKPPAPTANKKAKVEAKQPTKSPLAKDKHPKEKKAKSLSFSSPHVDAVVDFRSLNLPIAEFALASASDHAKGEDSPSEEEVEDEEPEPEQPKAHPLPKSTEVGRKWLNAVQKSQESPQFAREFDFDKCKEANEAIGDTTPWIKARPFGSWCKNNPQAIAIDCEMCETQDPVSKRKNPNALCRVSIVDAETDEILLNTLVKPDWPVTDHRTFINGISKSDLASVEFTVKHCQAFMMALCSEETVILGHAVVNDVKAMRMEHYCIADSAFLFRAADDETKSVSLKDLCAGVLGKEMPETHDSVNDARAALCCLEYYLEKDGKVEPIVRTPKQKRQQGRHHSAAYTPSVAHSQLFVHRIPKHVHVKHLEAMFLSTTKIAVDSVADIEFGEGSTGKTLCTFGSSEHANLAFNALKGDTETDPSGRLQKKVFLRGGEYIRIRKMIHEQGTRPKDRNRTPEKRDD